MKVTLDTINRMQAAGLIGKYAIGGAVGATFYLEPAARRRGHLEQGAADRDKIISILTRHNLLDKWERFKRRYLEE